MLDTERLLIREYKLEDIEALYNILSNSRTMVFWPRPFTFQETTSWVNRNIKSYQENGFGRMGVFLKEKGKLIGDAGIMITTIDGELKNDIGYIIHSKYQGQGYGFEAGKSILDCYRNRLDGIYANMPYNHSASIALAGKLGMEKIKEFYNKRNRDILTFVYSI
jgi:[ribosomal protein S5]-alanine N-acetyltransferase